MKNLLLFFFLLAFTISYSQKYTAEQVEKSDDPKVIAAFLKANPDHPRNEEFKIKMVTIIRKDNDPIAKPKVQPLNKEKLAKEYKKDVRDGVNNKNKQTAKVLTSLFSNDKNKSEAIVQIKNNSDCNMIVKFSGKDFYNLDVPARNQNFILVKKGNYILTTSVCDAKYSSAKKIYEDVVVSLSSK